MKHPSDRELAHFIHNCDEESLFLIISSVHSKLSHDSWSYFSDFLDEKIPLPAPGSDDRRIVATRVTEQLSYFGSHSIAYTLRKLSPFHDASGVPYSEVLRDAEELFFEQLSPKTAPSRVNSVADRERQITHLLLSRALEEIPESEVISMLGESGLDQDAAIMALRELKSPTVGAGVIFAAVHILGKKLVRDLLLSVLTAMLAKFAQKEGAKQVAIQIAKKFPQKAFVRVSNYAGWALLAWDAFQIAGPAKRVIVPSVASIAVLRTSERIGREVR